MAIKIVKRLAISRKSVTFVIRKDQNYQIC